VATRDLRERPNGPRDPTTSQPEDTPWGRVRDLAAAGRGGHKIALAIVASLGLTDADAHRTAVYAG
jgi:hypothetical protein